MLKSLTLEKDRFHYIKWLKSSKVIYFRNINSSVYLNFNPHPLKVAKPYYFMQHFIFFLKKPIIFVTSSQINALVKNFKRTISKKVILKFFNPSFFNMFKKPAQVRMGNGKGQKLNKQIYQFNYGFPFLYMRKLKAKSTLKIFKKLRGKAGISVRVLNLRRFFYSS